MSDATKLEPAKERLSQFVDRSSLSIIDQISMLATGEATVGALVNDIRIVLLEIDRLTQEVAGLRAGDDYLSRVCSIVDEAAKPVLDENERLRAVIERLASSEAFTVSQIIPHDGIGDECRARMVFAENALKNETTP